MMGDDPAEDPVRSDDEAVPSSRQHVRGSALLVVGRVLTMVISMVTQVILVRTFTKGDFGAFAYALALASAARTLLSLGQGRLLSRFMASYEEQGDYPRMFGAMLLAVGTITITSTVTVGAVYLFPDELIGSALNSQDAISLVLILIFLAPLESLDEVFLSLFAVFSKPMAIFFRKYLLAPGLRLAVVTILVLTDANATFVAIGYVSATLIGLLLYLGLMVRLLREQGLLQKVRLRQITVPFRAVFGFSFPLITGELTLVSMTAGSVVILGLYHSTVDIADYRAVFSSARLNSAIASSFVTLFLPVIARMYVRSDMEGLRRTYWHTASFVAVMSFPIFALTGPFAFETTVTLFGARYADSASVLAILAVGYYINVALGSNAYMLQVCGRIRYLVGVNLLSALLNLGLCFMLAPPFAALGVAGAHSITLVTQNILNQYALRGSIRTHFIGPDCRRSYAAIGGGAVSLWVFAFFVTPGILVSIGATMFIFILILAASQQALQLKETFPEISRIPIIRRLIR